MPNTLSKITSELYNLNTDELRTLQQRTHERIKARRKQDAKEMKQRLAVGDTVELHSLKSGNGQTGEVVEIKRTRAAVDLGNGVYNVPMNCLKIVE